MEKKPALTLRPYQQKVLKCALLKNTLAFLPTGAGDSEINFISAFSNL
jgi:ERCC4-related helicase